jgi:hypothetical protein
MAQESLPITFMFEGVTYQVSPDAYDTDLIKLPDGRLLRVEGWIEKAPPSPIKLQLAGPMMAYGEIQVPEASVVANK